MTETEDRRKLTAYRALAETLIKVYMSHKQRNEKMIVLYNMIRRDADKQIESDHHNRLCALMEILTFAVTQDELTHHDVKTALWLFVDTCTAGIMALYTGAPIDTPATPDWIPF